MSSHSDRLVYDAPAWLSYLNVDLIINAAQKTVLHPFVAWMLPLSLRAVTVPYTHPSFLLTAAYAVLLSLCHLFVIWSESYAHGPPREVNAEEVVVITGGASGLGSVLAGFYRMRGTSVAVLDVQPLQDDESGVQWYSCDVSDPGQVAKAANLIRRDLGVPSVLINCAAIVNGKSIIDLSNHEIQRCLSVNLTSQFITVKEFLPGMLKEERGTIVTVSSVLGYLGSASLSDYAASKAGLNAFHASLKAELGNSKLDAAKSIKLILVAPGQLGTGLFSFVKTPSGFLAPILEPVHLAKEVVQMIDDGRGGEIRLPFYAQWIPLLGALPAGLQKLFRGLSGLDTAVSPKHVKEALIVPVAED